MNPYMSWAILLLTAGGLGYYYKNGSAPKARPAFLKPATEKQDSGPAGNKKTKQRNKTRKAQSESNGNSNSSEGSNSVSTPVAVAVAEPKKEQKEQKVQSIAQAEEPTSNSNGGMDDNYEFAKQFSKVKNGTPLAGKSKAGTSTKGKASRAGKQAQQPSTNGDSHANHVSTAASSTTGADADDDMSPINSPVVKPAGDVSDMLEEPAPAASVLRLTGLLEDAQNGKTKKQNNFKPAETKKQRQARRKREEKNEMVKEAEKNRRAMVENQMHTAREFERQQAKAKPAPAPLPNAWESAPSPTPAATLAPATNGNSTKPSTIPLLDTFEPSQPTPKPTAGDKKSSTKTPWAKDLPSEEEQMRMLNTLSSENEWTTVSNRKKEKRSKANAESMSEASSSEQHSNFAET
ncbi:uncharacterized protein GIQ15_05559 [Arthroderma uncinatum]|uniref:uncharacterized protein n=1 Tax=Arthroderma uncinatum TaxID=74035 RepID=UPI00144AE2FE|nr:uncharacterized protein GIQ15_05559 [Arthroderma uncinatum]KAF3480212.1 hypothetical protein GIQ15_05559 [Arthroderma uncinatum]